MRYHKIQKPDIPAYRLLAIGIFLPSALREVIWRRIPAPLLSLGASTLTDTKANYSLTRALLRKPEIWDHLKSTQNKVALVVPILSGGRAFYPTRIVPFAGFNPLAKENEITLHKLLQKAKKRGVSVYFSLDTLGWHYPEPEAALGSGGNPSHFSLALGLEELTKDQAPPANGTHFVSPWVPGVKEALEAFVTECAHRYPDRISINRSASC